MKIKFLKLFFIFMIFITNAQNLKNGDYIEKINGLNLHYSIRGNGPVMLVGHPNAGKIGYELTLKPLEKYFTMVYYDPRGTGKSDAPKNLQEYEQEHLVEEIEQLRRTLRSDKIWLFGHSDQSAIAMIYALKYPHYTEGLILTGTGMVGSQEEDYEKRKSSESERIKNSEWFSQVIKDWDFMIEHHTQTTPDGRNISDAPIKWWCYDEESSQKVIKIANKITQAGRRKPIDNEWYNESDKERNKYLEKQKQFSRIKVKTLIINGKYDTNNPPQYAFALQKILPNSTLKIIDQAGHFPWVENEQTTFEAIEQWLRLN